jgi:hypothetical protein
MPVSSCDESISRSLPSNSPARSISDVAPPREYPLVNVAVIYAPLAVWRDSHWICTVTNPAPMPDRLE